MELSAIQIGVAIVGSFMAGAINTLSGNGSVITLSILTDMIGLPGNMANGTNRIGVVMQSAGSGYGFAKNNLLPLKKSRCKYSPPII